MVKYPNFSLEKKLWDRGLEYIAGIDEAGRGAWAGPLSVGAVVLPPDFKINGIRDSKLLAPAVRERLAGFIKKKALAWRIEIADPGEIDRLGILAVTKKLMRLAFAGLDPAPEALLTDAVKLTGIDVPHQAIVNGDRKIVTVAAASILAKVERDSVLRKLHRQFPEYCFDKHKGYGTKLHRERLAQFGPCAVHRFSYEPIRRLAGEEGK